MNSDDVILSAYGSHNSAFAISYKGQYNVVETERWLNEKNAGLVNYLPCKNPQIVFDEITGYLLKSIGKENVDLYLTGYMQIVKPKFNYKKHASVDHHTRHARCAFYQSPYKKSLVFSFDGGGDLGFYNVYMADRQNGIELLEKFNQDLGFPYMIFGDYLKDIKQDPLNIGNLVYSGKLMGLCSYGKVNQEWLPHFNRFYEKFNYTKKDSFIGGAETMKGALMELFKSINVDFEFRKTRFEGQLAYDIAATSQQAFEDQFFRFAKKYLDQYSGLPVCLSGGCALNVILNSKLLKLRNNQVFVPPNVNDCGIAVGSILYYTKPEHAIDLTYSGIPILDADEFGSYVQESTLNVHEDVSIVELSEYLSEGNIVGVIQGNSEHGSRALGNRSILCNPVGDMKDVLNDKVKHREWYRPFAPVTRLEDAPKYFEWNAGVESRHMTFVATTRQEWRDKLPAITHVDNTARLQTVTESQNPFLYKLLTEFEKFSGHGVLLNTSFNVNGKPILSRMRSAIDILQQTKMDAVYYNGNLIVRSVHDTFSKKRKDAKIKLLKDQVGVNVFSFPKTNEDKRKHIEYIKQLLANEKNCFIITEGHLEREYKQLLDNPKNVDFFAVTKKHWFYNALQKSVFPDEEIDTLSAMKYSKLLFIKDLLEENLSQSKFHIFIDLNTLDSSSIREINILTKTKPDDEHVIISSDKEFNTVYSIPLIEKQMPSLKIEGFPTSKIIFGNINNLIFFSRYYEAMLLEAWNNGIAAREGDVLLQTYIHNIDKLKLIN